ncbi:MAG: diiron oxygenase [Micromonosporaceae bacterium]
MPVQSAASTPVHSGTAPAAVAAYRSSFDRWDRRASVRVKPRRTLADGAPGRPYFPPELVPAASHPLVVHSGPDAVDRVLVHRLYQYLFFTSELEQVAVMPVTMRLCRLGSQLPAQMREDAFKITTDEAWHAQFSHDLMAQVHKGTGVAPRLPTTPQFADRLDQVSAGLDLGRRDIEATAFAIVSETLISTILVDVPRDLRLPRAVRELVADHAEDEGRHHAYFRALLDLFWPALSPAVRRRIGPVLPDLIRLFLEPDYRGIGFALFDLGLSDAQVAQVLAESYPAERVDAEIAAAAQATVRYFGEVGALDEPATADAFLAAGLT